jgi:hypothetical protein
MNTPHIESQAMSQIAILHAQKALSIQKTLGIRRAAGFLRNKGVPVEDAVRILATRRAA